MITVNAAELRAALAIRMGELRIDAGTLTPNIAEFLRTHFAGAPIVITAAVADPGVEDAVLVRGRTTLFAARDVPVELRAEVDELGAARLSLRYTVSGTWRFSHSFPALPKVVDWTRTIGDPTISALDALPFTDMTFTAASDSGITFAARLRPTGVDVLDHLLSGAEPMTVRGMVVPEGATAPELSAGGYPWATERPAPGIHAVASVPATPTVGRLGLDELTFRLYSPLTDAWLTDNPTYRPVFGYAMRLTIPSAERRTVTVFADLQLGAREVLLVGSFTGFALGSSLSALADLIGPDDLRTGLPADLRAPEVLKNLELTGAAISLVRSAAGVCVGWVSVTVGLPELRWRVWDEHFEVRSVFCRFDLDDPFGQAPRNRSGGGGLLSRLSVTLRGAMVVEGVPVTVVAGTADGFQVHAELAEGQVIALRRLMKTHLPDVPAPGDLSVDMLRLSVAPGRSYGMAMALAGQPNPWRVPLGPVELTFSDVFFAFTNPKGGNASGTFRGTIALGGASLAAGCSVPGPLVLRGKLDRIGLTELARELAAVTELPVPPGFPELTLHDSEVVFSADGGRYDVRVGTTVTIGDVANLKLAAAVLRTPDATGFAVGIWTGRWPHGTGWSPGSVWEPLRALTIENAGLFLCSLAPSAAQLATLVPAADVPATLQRAFRLRAGVNFLARLRLDTGAVAILRELFDGDVRLDLFAAYGRDGSTALVARLDVDQTRNAFVFSEFELTWESTSASAGITARASGALAIGDERLRYRVSGRLSSEGTGALTLDVADWVHPFGHQRLTVKQVAISVALGAEGVTLGLAGTFQFSTAAGTPFTFAVAGAITDFEVPTALAFLLRNDSPGRVLRLSEVIEGITTIDPTSLDTPVGYTPLAVQLRVLDLFLAIEELCFWTVAVDRVTIDGREYSRGFGFRGKITLFGRPVVLTVEAHEAQRRFAGRAELPEPVSIGAVFSLRRKGEPDKGPVLAVSSQVDTVNPDHLYVSAELALLDVFRGDCYAKANDRGLVFALDLAAGTVGTGAWATQHLELVVSREKWAFSAGFSCDFGFSDVTLGGFTLFDVLRVPELTLPDFSVHATLNVSASPPTFHLSATVDFTFLGLALDERVTIDLDLRDAPATLSAIGSTLLDSIRNNLATLLTSALGTAGELADWITANLSALGDTAIGQLTKVLREAFGLGSAVALNLLSVAGIPGDLLGPAMADVYHWSDAVLAAAVEAFDEFTTHVADFLGSREVTMVVFNLTSHRLQVTGAHGDEITPRTDLVIGPGGTGEVAVYGASTGTWEWVFLRDLDTGAGYQLYIQLSSVIGNRYFSFDHYNPDNKKENEGSRRLPADVANSTWTGGPAAAYVLSRVP